MTNTCKQCGREFQTDQAVQKFCERACYLASLRGNQPPQLRRVAKVVPFAEIKDGSIDAGLLLLADIPIARRE